MSGPLVTLDGKRGATAKVVVPFYGIPFASVELAQADSVATKTKLVLADLTLTCAVHRSAPYGGSRTALVVGGYGGWRQKVSAQSYQNDDGVTLSMVLGDVAGAVGEQIAIAQDRVLGSHYTRDAAQASKLLRLLAGEAWWVDAAGVTQIGTRTSSAITTTFQVVKFDGARGIAEIATESVKDWMPGRTFAGVGVPGTQTIAMTSIDVTNDGKLRVRVLTTGAANA